MIYVLSNHSRAIALGSNERIELSDRIIHDPRLSTAQKEALRAIARYDRDAVVDGLDQKMYPVVSAKMSGPGVRTRWALQRNGAATRAREPFAEKWS